MPNQNMWLSLVKAWAWVKVKLILYYQIITCHMSFWMYLLHFKQMTLCMCCLLEHHWLFRCTLLTISLFCIVAEIHLNEGFLIRLSGQFNYKSFSCGQWLLAAGLCGKTHHQINNTCVVLSWWSRTWTLFCMFAVSLLLMLNELYVVHSVLCFSKTHFLKCKM